MAHMFTDTVSDSTAEKTLLSYYKYMSTDFILHYSIHKIKNKVHNLDWMKKNLFNMPLVCQTLIK